MLDSFLPILIFPQTMAPNFRRGFPSILSFALMAIVFVRKCLLMISYWKIQKMTDSMQFWRISCTSANWGRMLKHILINHHPRTWSWRQTISTQGTLSHSQVAMVPKKSRTLWASSKNVTECEWRRPWVSPRRKGQARRIDCLNNETGGRNLNSLEHCALLVVAARILGYVARHECGFKILPISVATSWHKRRSRILF